MLNDEIKKFKQGDDYAFSNIVAILRNDINFLICKYEIPGMDADDRFSIAMEEILDCIRSRELKRGVGIKKVIDENDSESKNKNFIKAAINYRFMRELRSTKSNIRVSYDIPFLQENGDTYKDRKGKPLYVGIIFHNGIPYLIENQKNTKVIINIGIQDINRNESTYDFKNPLDNNFSLDQFINDEDNEHELRDALEFKISEKVFKNNQKVIDNSIMFSIINNKPIKRRYKRIIKSLLKKSQNDIKDLKDFVNRNPKSIKPIKKFLKEVLL